MKKGKKGLIAARGALLAAAVTPIAAMVPALPAYAAEVTLPPISIGAGARSSFTSTNVDGPGKDINDFTLDSARIYIGGAITDVVKFTFNTEYQGDSENDVQIMDAIARFEFSPKVNIWAGRFLPPSDRANLYGPYYANNFAVYNDGIQDGYPSVAVGRDNGVAYWGDFDRVKLSFGVFDVPSTMAASGNGDDLLYAARLMVSLWDIETGYYLNGTYYGGKDILSFGVAGQSVDGDSSVTVDGLMEKKLGGGGVITLEGEYASYEGKAGGYGYADGDLNITPDFESSDGGYGLVSYLFPEPIGIGKIQLLGKYATNTYDTPVKDVDRNTLEAEVNYIIKAFNARLSLFYVDTSFDGAGPAGSKDFTQVGLGFQVQI